MRVRHFSLSLIYSVHITYSSVSNISLLLLEGMLKFRRGLTCCLAAEEMNVLSPWHNLY